MLETIFLKNDNDIVNKKVEKPSVVTSTFSMENLLNTKIVGKHSSGEKNLMFKIKNSENPRNRSPLDSDTEDDKKKQNNNEEQNDFYSDNNSSISPNNFESNHRKSDDINGKNYTEINYDRSTSPDPEESQSSGLPHNLESSPKNEDDKREPSDYTLPQKLTPHNNDNNYTSHNLFKHESVFSQFFRNENYLTTVNNRNYYNNQNLCNTFDCYQKTLPVYRDNRNFHRNCNSINCGTCDNTKIQRLDGFLLGKCKGGGGGGGGHLEKKDENSIINLKQQNKGKDDEDGGDDVVVKKSPTNLQKNPAAEIDRKPALKFSVNAILGTNHHHHHQGINKPGKLLIF